VPNVELEPDTHRALQLLDSLRRLGGFARTSHLASALEVSEETIRRTVKKLSKKGAVSRVHGGVYLTDDGPVSSFYRRIGEHSTAKRAIGHMAASLVVDGTSLFLDVGTTTTFVAEALREKQELLVVTNSINAAQALMNHNQNRVFMAGGELQRDECGTFGSTALEFIGRFNFDTAIMSVDALDAQQGFLLSDHREAEISRMVMRRAKTRIVAADQTKIGKTAPIRACSPEDVDTLITDDLLPADFMTAFKTWGIDVLTAPPKIKKPKKNPT
jgi:DeoR family transcriptional regulator, glycerol-3-phosphate regulon repressor